MHTYAASPKKSWILDSGVSSHMTGIKQKFVFLNMSTAHPSVKIADGTQFTCIRQWGSLGYSILDSY